MSPEFWRHLSAAKKRLDERLNDKASQAVVTFWGPFVTAWTSILVGTVVAIIKLWP
jgi:hypothetical protein